MEKKVKTTNEIAREANEVFNKQFIKPVGNFASLDVKITDKMNSEKTLVIGKYLSFIFRRKNGENSYTKEYNDVKNYVQFAMSGTEIDTFSYLLEIFTTKRLIKGKDELSAISSFLKSNYLETKVIEEKEMLVLQKELYHEKNENNNKTLKFKYQFKKTGSYYTFTGIFFTIGGKVNNEPISYMGTVINGIEAYGLLNLIKKRAY